MSKDPTQYRPTGDEVEIFSMKNYETACITLANGKQLGLNCFRPTGITFDRTGALWVASDATSEIVRVVVTGDVNLVQQS
jgi:hypothetical protein